MSNVFILSLIHICGNPLTSSTRSLDHLYPRDYGGISVPNNLVPCCKDCNGKKNNFKTCIRDRHMCASKALLSLTHTFLI